MTAAWYAPSTCLPIEGARIRLLPTCLQTPEDVLQFSGLQWRHYRSLPFWMSWFLCNNLINSRFTWCSADLTPRLTWEHWIYGNYNAAPCPAEFLWNTRQRLHVNVTTASLSDAPGVPLTRPLSYIRNDYFLCKSMNEIRAAGTYTCHVPLFRSIQGAQD